MPSYNSQEFCQSIIRLGTDLGSLLGFCRYLLACSGITLAIVAERQNDTLLLEAGDLGNLFGTEGGEK